MQKSADELGRSTFSAVLIRESHLSSTTLVPRECEDFLDVGGNHGGGLDGVAVPTLIDLFRLRHTWGRDLVNSALKQWLRQRGNSPSALLSMAERFPKARPGIQQALEILL